jgi:S1-C subfamily serine protease
LSENKSDQRNYERPVLDQPQRLGITISSDSNPALRIEGIRVGSAAEKAGLKPGQFIYALDDTSHLGASEFRRRIAGASGTVKLRVGRDGRIRDVIVPLAGKPLRVGISWRTNSAEPNSVTVSDVTTGLPAERGGLQRLDRIHEIDGKPIDSSENFRDRMTTLEGNVEVLIERDGNLQVKRLDLPAVRE